MASSSRELLVVILDTNPVWWSLVSLGKLGTTANANINNAANKENVNIEKKIQSNI